jgi:selenocysteine lyase/cysteine desulfurase
MGGLAALGASLDLLIGYGIDAICARLLEVSDELCRRLQELGAVVASCRQPNCKSGIVSFGLAGHDPQRVRAKCREQNVLISCRGGKLRASPHVYTNGDDIDRLGRVLRET